MLSSSSNASDFALCHLIGYGSTITTSGLPSGINLFSSSLCLYITSSSFHYKRFFHDKDEKWLEKLFVDFKEEDGSIKSLKIYNVQFDKVSN